VYGESLLAAKPRILNRP